MRRAIELNEIIERHDQIRREAARERQRVFAQMHDELGMTDQEIADAVGRARSTVEAIRRGRGLGGDT